MAKRKPRTTILSVRNQPTKRYTKVIVKPYPRKSRKYPYKAKEIVFVMPSADAVQAVEMLMCYMGYGANQYRFVSAEGIPSLNVDQETSL